MRSGWGQRQVTTGDVCVCVPARNEAERLPKLLDALAGQSLAGRIVVAVAVNNTSDDSLRVIEQAAVMHAARLDIHVTDVNFLPALAHAGSARRLAMDTGMSLLSSAECGILVSTDADASPPPRWLENILAAFSRGADLVGGRIEIDRSEALPKDVLDLREAWDSYWQAVRAIEDALDPIPWNPAPRHGDHTGASLAIRCDLYAACGGVPIVPTGEDCALVKAALAHGGRLAHPDDVFTFVSGRTDGRAEGGMAQAMRELFDHASAGSVPMAPGFDQWRERAMWRRRLRSRPRGNVRVIQEESLLPPMRCDMQLEVRR